MGYLSYDLVRQFESLPNHADDDLHFPDLEFAFYDLAVAFDHSSDEWHLMFCPPLERFLGEPREKLYREGCDRLASLEAQLSTPLPQLQSADLLAPVSFQPQQSRASYMDRVRRCQEFIAAGDLYQANLSHRFSVYKRQFHYTGWARNGTPNLCTLAPHEPFSVLRPVAYREHPPHQHLAGTFGSAERPISRYSTDRGDPTPRPGRF